MFVSGHEWLRGISEQELAVLGLDVVAYIKPINKNGNKSEPGFTIHAANGASIGSSESLDSAVCTVYLNDLIPLSVH